MIIIIITNRIDRIGRMDADALIAGFVEQKESLHTQRAYLRDLQAFFGRLEISVDLAAGVDATDVDAFVKRGESSGLSKATLQRRLSALRQFFDWLSIKGVVESNPARDGRVRTPMPRRSTSASASGALSREEAERLVASVDTTTATGRRDRAILMLILHCALRRSEVVRVRVDDFRLVGRYRVLDIRPRDRRSNAVPGDNRPETTGFGPSETLSGRAKVPDHVYRHVEAVRMDVGIRSGVLFRSYSNRNRGASLTGDAIYRIVRAAGEAADLEDVTPDRLRKTGLQLALDSGATGDQVRAHGRYAATAPFAARQEERLRDSAADYVQVGDGRSEACSLDSKP